MKLRLVTLLAPLVLSAGAELRAEDAAGESAKLEADFKATMTAATLKGRSLPLQNGTLGDDRDDSYSIESVEKVSGSSWIIHAHLRFGGQDAVVPVPVQVKWAGDTAVLIVDHLQVPGGTASYTARLLIHEHTYAGTWSGGDHGGLLAGVITNEKAESAK